MRKLKFSVGKRAWFGIHSYLNQTTHFFDKEMTMLFRKLAQAVAAIQRPQKRRTRQTVIGGDTLEVRVVLSAANPLAAVGGSIPSGQVGFETGPIGSAGRQGFEVGPIGRLDLAAHTGEHQSGMSSSALPVPDVLSQRAGQTDLIGYIWGPHGHQRGR